MKEVFFNEDGTLNINDTIMDQLSYKKIMEDGVVTKEEVDDQSKLVMDLFRKVEDTLDAEQKELVKELIVESNVLYAVYQAHMIMEAGIK